MIEPWGSKTLKATEFGASCSQPERPLWIMQNDTVSPNLLVERNKRLRFSERLSKFTDDPVLHSALLAYFHRDKSKRSTNTSTTTDTSNLGKKSLDNSTATKNLVDNNLKNDAPTAKFLPKKFNRNASVSDDMNSRNLKTSNSGGFHMQRDSVQSVSSPSSVLKFTNDPFKTSEDCLTLNIYTPCVSYQLFITLCAMETKQL